MDTLTVRLRRFIRTRVASREDAEDAVQEAYLRLLRYAERHEVENPEHLLFAAARNIAVDNQRRQRVREKTAADYAILEVCSRVWPSADEVVDARQRLKRVEAAVAELPVRCREVFLLHRIQGLSYSQIAGRCGISSSAVEKHIARAMLQIDAKLNSEDDSR